MRGRSQPAMLSDVILGEGLGQFDATDEAAR
jgi:hypothetical protein